MNSLESDRPSHGRSDSLLSAASGAEDLFSSIAAFDDMAGDDELSFDDSEEGRDMLGELGSGRRGSMSGASSGLVNGKRTSSTAEKKATHNAVERARRESLNTRFLVLADMLPGMNHVKRASKAAIVNKSIDLIRELQVTEARMAKENAALKAELAALRQGGSSSAPAPAAAPAPATAPMAMPVLPAFGHLFAHGMFPGVEQHASFDVNGAHVSRSDSASPASHASGSMPHPPSTAGSGMNGAAANPFSAAAAAAAAAVANGYFDMSSITGANTSSSPISYTSHSPAAATIATVAAPSSNGNNTAPSPASSNSVQTPANAFSPSSLPNFTDVASNGSPQQQGANIVAPNPNPAIAAFEASADPSYLAAAYGPRDLAKAQQELQSFIAYQQRIAGNPSVQGAPPQAHGGHHGPTPSTAHLPFHIAASMYPFHNHAQQQQQQVTPPSPFCASPAVANIPAWQMMMAQQAALTAYGGAGQF